MRIEELVLEGEAIFSANVVTISEVLLSRLQVIPSSNPNYRLGPVFQRDYWSQWIWEIEHSRRDCICTWDNQHVCGAYTGTLSCLCDLTMP